MSAAFLLVVPGPYDGKLGLAVGVLALPLCAALPAWGGVLLYLRRCCRRRSR
ncbi:hypothetical protein ABZ467_31300 [Streptomyces sp. NPDC005727]|uniref:hypothetical protein n=1 Tax=Streptomyces sp. NPDC005727 TaxID=3157053 RepID=UPI0033E3BFA1